MDCGFNLTLQLLSHLLHLQLGWGSREDLLEVVTYTRIVVCMLYRVRM